MSVSNVMKAVSYKWKGLPKENKLPFELIAGEDKQRYDRETSLFKKGEFLGRVPTSSSQTSMLLNASRHAAGQENSAAASVALDINEDLLQFITANCQQISAQGASQDQNKGNEFVDVEEEIDDDDQDQFESGLPALGLDPKVKQEAATLPGGNEP